MIMPSFCVCAKRLMSCAYFLNVIPVPEFSICQDVSTTETHLWSSDEYFQTHSQKIRNVPLAKKTRFCLFHERFYISRAHFMQTCCKTNSNTVNLRSTQSDSFSFLICISPSGNLIKVMLVKLYVTDKKNINSKPQ